MPTAPVAARLYDAIGKGISKTNVQIEEGDHVLVTIITDGEENSSEEWTLKMVRSMIEKLKKQGWTFTLIGTITSMWRVWPNHSPSTST